MWSVVVCGGVWWCDVAWVGVCGGVCAGVCVMHVGLWRCVSWCVLWYVSGNLFHCRYESVGTCWYVCMKAYEVGVYVEPCANVCLFDGVGV